MHVTCRLLSTRPNSDLPSLPLPGPPSVIHTQCSGCFREYKLDNKYAGKTIRCKDCGTPFKVVESGDEPLDVEFDDPPSPSRPHAPAPRSATPKRSPGKRSKRGTSDSSSRVWLWVGGGVLATLLVCCGGISLVVMKVRQVVVEASKPDIDLGDPTQLFPLGDVPLPQFPPLGPAAPVGRSDVQLHFVDFGSIPANGEQPGMRMKMRVYVPVGQHAERSLPCVLVAPAGTNLLTGNDMDNDDYHDETLPYAEEGMVVVFYSLDGGLTDMAEGEQLRDAYLSFRRARAGVVNGRNALDYILAQVPQVDPQRIYSAGHSSAATLSLLLAAHEPRLRGCLAYAPATDVEARLEGAGDNAVLELLLPGIGDFLKQSSPKTHVARINCPIFLFHARDDSNEPFASTEAFARLLESNGKTLNFAVAESGDHYDSMIQEGIPRGIEWVKAQSPASTAPAERP